MNAKKYLNAGVLSAAFCLTVPAWVLADSVGTASNDKMGTTTTPAYDTGASHNTTTSANTSAETKTVPSGKRHRTHKKQGNQGQTADANKTINAGDVTPSK